jgi:large subunit ribosomal protein L31
MKKDFHPKVHKDAKTTCVSCSSVYAIPSTVKDQQVEVCGNCHPVYTGEYRGIMSSGRVDRFRKVQEASKGKQAEVAAIEEARKAKPAGPKAKKKAA